MNELFTRMKEGVLRAAESIAVFTRANKRVLIGGFTVLGILLIVWARLGFTFEIGRFFAAQDQGAGEGGGGGGGQVSSSSCGSLGGTVCLARTAGSCGAGFTDVGTKTSDCDSGFGYCCKPAAAATPTPGGGQPSTVSCGSLGGTVCLPRTATTCGTGFRDVGQKTADCDSGAGLCCAPGSATSGGGGACGPSIPEGGEFDWGFTTSEPWGDCQAGASNAGAGTYWTEVSVGTCHPNGLHLVWRAEHRQQASCDLGLAGAGISEGQGITTDNGNFNSANDLPNGQAGTARMTYNASTFKCGSVRMYGAFWADGQPGVYVWNNAGNTGYYKVINYGVNCGAGGATPAPTGGATPAPTVIGTPLPSVNPVACAPLTQNVAANAPAAMQASGGTGTFQWVSEGQSQTGATASFTFTTTGTKIVTVTSGGATASCLVTVGAAATVTPTPTSTPGAADLVFSVTGLNASTGSAESTSVQAVGGNHVEIVMRLRNPSATNPVQNASVRASLPGGLTSVAGSTTIGGVATSVDTITTGGVTLGVIGPSQESVVRFRAAVNGAAFPAGTSQAIVSTSAQADGIPVRSGQVTVLVTRQALGTEQTGPGDAALVALLVSGIATLLYVSYTNSSAFRRGELEKIGTGRDPLDFK